VLAVVKGNVFSYNTVPCSKLH